MRTFFYWAFIFMALVHEPVSTNKQKYSNFSNPKQWTIGQDTVVLGMELE